MNLDPKQVLENAAKLWLGAVTKEDFDRLDGLTKTYADLTGASEVDAFWAVANKAHFGDAGWPN